MSFVNGYLNFTGSKYKLLEQIVPEMDYTKKYFVDLFCGSFVVGANVVNKYERVLANDIIEELVGIHRELLESDDIIDDVKLLCPSKDDFEAYNNLRNSFNEDKTPAKLWALILSCNSNMMRFNKSYFFNQTWGKRSFSDNTQKKIDEFTKKIRPYKDRIRFTSRHFTEINLKVPAMVYIDPPYSNSEAGYNAYWQKDDDKKLYEYCKRLDDRGSSFMLSGVLTHDGNQSVLLEKFINDGFRYKGLDFDYDKISKKGKKETNEIIVMNY